VAVSNSCEVGVDIEQVREMRDANGLVERYFSLDERDDWQCLRVSERAEAFHGAWVRKEACAKALGWGLSMPLDSLDVGWAPGPKALDLCLPDGSLASVSVFSLQLGPGWAGAVAWIHFPSKPTSEFSQ
jgi:4'-phosphopantetheinyl transferase